MRKLKRKRSPHAVPIRQEALAQASKPKVIAHDPEGHRMIFAIGSQRFALDLKTAITRLDPATGDKPASIVPFYKPKKEEP